MMGSLLIINGGELFFGLPSGMPCPPTPAPVTGGHVHDVSIVDFAFSPAIINIAVGDTVRWTNIGSDHTVTSIPGTVGCAPASMESFDSGVVHNGGTFNHTFGMAGTFAYHCEIHGCGMSGTITVS